MTTYYGNFCLFLAIVQVYPITKITDAAWLFFIQYTEAPVTVCVFFNLQ